MGTVAAFLQVLQQHGSNVRYHRDDSITECPCLTPEGFRDPEWHDANPTAPVCNERGFLADPASSTDVIVKAFVEPSQSTRATRLTTQYLTEMFGELQSGDHIGIFPYSWAGVDLHFYNWSPSGEDFIVYDNDTYIAVAAHLLPDPSDGNPHHHWEVGLRLVDESL